MGLMLYKEQEQKHTNDHLNKKINLKEKCWVNLVQIQIIFNFVHNRYINSRPVQILVMFSSCISLYAGVFFTLVIL